MKTLKIELICEHEKLEFDSVQEIAFEDQLLIFLIQPNSSTQYGKLIKTNLPFIITDDNYEADHFKSDYNSTQVE